MRINRRFFIGGTLALGAGAGSIAALGGASPFSADSGRRIVKHVPRPTSESQRISPPCLSTTVE